MKIKKQLLNNSESAFKSVLSNSIMLIINMIIPFAIFVYLANIIDPLTLGSYNWATTVVSYISTITAFGLTIKSLKEMGAQLNNKEGIESIINENLEMRISILLIASFFVFFGSFYIQIYDQHRILLLFILMIQLPFEIYSCEWVYTGLGMQSKLMIRNLVSKLVLLILTLLLMKKSNDFDIFLIIYTGILCLTYAYNSNYIISEYTVPNILSGVKKLSSKTNILNFVMILLTSIYGKLDIIIIGAIISETDFALFSTAYRFIGIALVFITSITMVLLGKANSYYRDNSNKYENLIQNCINIVLIISIFFTSFSISYSNLITKHLFQNELQLSHTYIGGLSVLFIFWGISNVLIYQVLYLKLEPLRIISILLPAYFIYFLIISVGYNHIGGISIIAAVGVSAAFIMLLVIREVKLKFNLFIFNKDTLKIIAANFFVCIYQYFSLQIYDGEYKLIFHAVISLLIYLFLLLSQRLKIIDHFSFK